MNQSILCNRQDIRQTKTEEQYNFIVYVLQNVGLPLEDVLPEEYKDFSVEHKIKLRELLFKFDITLVNDRDDGVMIYVDKTLIAKWKKPHVILRTDLSEIDPAKRMYAEIQTEWWSVFEA